MDASVCETGYVRKLMEESKRKQTERTEQENKETATGKQR